MAQHLLKAPDTVAVTDQIQAVTLPETSCWYSIRNAGSADVYFISISTDGYTAATYNDKTAAQLRTAGCGMVKSGETLAFFTDHPHIYLVCTNGLTATANIEPGILGPTVNVEANLGNVGLLDDAETEVMGTLGGAADVDGGLTQQLRFIGEAVDTLETLLGTIDTDTGNIANGLANGTLTRTVVNFTAGGAGTTAIVAAGSACLYVVACGIWSDTEVGLTLNSDTTATQLTGIIPVSQRSGFILTPWPGITGGWFKGDSTKNLTITVSAACDIDGFIVTRDLA